MTKLGKPPALEPMSPVDRAWLDMDSPHNPMVMVGVVDMRTRAPAEEVARTFVERLLRNSRFSQVAEGDNRPPRWRSEAALDWRYHVHICRQRDVPNRQAMMRALHHELSLPLDHDRPLWRMCFFPGRGGRLVGLFRAHHAVADGVAMMRLLHQLDDAAPVEATEDHPGAHSAHIGPLGHVIDRLEFVNTALLGAGRMLADEVQHPQKLRDQLSDGRDIALAVARVLRLPVDAPSCLTGRLAGRRAVSWAAGIKIEPLRAVAHAHGATVNDVFLTALAGAFRAELRDRDELAGVDQAVRVAIPVNLRADGDGAVGNRFGLVLLDLPVGESRWAVRLACIRERMTELKHSPEARAVLLSLALAGQLPTSAEQRLIDLIADKTVAVVSNLAGPVSPLHIGGAEVSDLTFFPPQAGHIGIGVSLISYAGAFTVGVSADAQRIADPDGFVRRLRRELRRMGATAGD